MKKVHIAPYCIAFAVGNCFLPLLLGQVGEIMEWVYHGAKGWESMLAGCTRLALALPSWFYIFTALSILACAGLFIRRVSVSLLVHWLLAVCILECGALSFFAFSICASLAPIFEMGGS
jgi:hypothetical protein